MSRLLVDLTPELYLPACQLLAIGNEQLLPCMIIFTGRTQKEQNDLWQQGRDATGKVIDKSKVVTWTKDSKHVMTAARGFKSDAIDICPYDQFNLHGPDKLKWDENDPAWAKLGAIGEKLGLKWGVWLPGPDGKLRRTDVGHFEFIRKAVPPVT